MALTGQTPVYAVLGHPVGHSASPALHNAWFAHHHIDGVYVALTCRAPGSRLADALHTLGLRGANLTVPLKREILPHLDQVHGAAKGCGAVNTVVARRGRLHGYNTDVDGFIDGLLADGIDPRDRKIAILGAGGAARAVAAGLSRARCGPMRIFNRTETHAASLIAELDLDATTAPLLPSSFAAWRAELVVQTLPGAARDRILALPTDHLPDDAAWSDLNYWDDAPPHVAILGARGLQTQTGHAMLVHQAAHAFRHFTGVSPAIDVGWAALGQRSELVRPTPPQ